MYLLYALIVLKVKNTEQIRPALLVCDAGV